MFGDYGGGGAAEEASTRLHWSQDPAESLSDWTVEVHMQGRYPAVVHGTYHCHSNILGVGPASSEYFARIFRSGAFTEDSKRTSVIELPVTAAQAFPVLLDFMYDCATRNGREGLKATGGNAVALLHLSNYLGVRKAFDAVTVFITGNLTYKTAIGYLLEAETYTQDKVSAVATRVLAANAELVPVGDFDRIAPPELFLRIVQSPEFTCHSQLFSKHVARYCAQHRVDAAMLCRLTDAKLMPKVSPCVAKQLLREALAHQHQPLDKTCAGSSSLGNEGKEGGSEQRPTSKRQRVSVEPGLVSAEMDSVGSVASGAAGTEPLLASLRERCVVSTAAHYGLIFSAAKAGAPEVQQQSMGMPSCIIAGATGPSAALVNGTYQPIDETYNGRVLFRKEGDGDKWLMYVTTDGSNYWMVSTTASKDANNGGGWAYCNEKGLPDPTQAATWKVVDSGGFLKQPAVTCAAPQVYYDLERKNGIVRNHMRLDRLPFSRLEAYVGGRPESWLCVGDEVAFPLEACVITRIIGTKAIEVAPSQPSAFPGIPAEIAEDILSRALRTALKDLRKLQGVRR